MSGAFSRRAYYPAGYNTKADRKDLALASVEGRDDFSGVSFHALMAALGTQESPDRLRGELPHALRAALGVTERFQDQFRGRAFAGGFDFSDTEIAHVPWEPSSGWVAGEPVAVTLQGGRPAEVRAETNTVRVPPGEVTSEGNCVVQVRRETNTVRARPRMRA